MTLNEIPHNIPFISLIRFTTEFQIMLEIMQGNVQGEITGLDIKRVDFFFGQ